jgi:hypothetical protein
VQLDTWQVILFCIALIGGFAGLIKILFMQFEKNLGRRFDSLESDAKEWVRLEREFLTFKADLPLHYVRREDYVRGQTIIEAKLDHVATKIENIQLKGATR